MRKIKTKITQLKSNKCNFLFIYLILPSSVLPWIDGYIVHRRLTTRSVILKFERHWSTGSLRGRYVKTCILRDIRKTFETEIIIKFYYFTLNVQRYIKCSLLLNTVDVNDVERFVTLVMSEVTYYLTVRCWLNILTLLRGVHDYFS